jgi:hypothetical protein
MRFDGARPPSLAGAFAVPFIFATLIAIACGWAAGRSLGLFFGPVLLVPMIAPQLYLMRLAGVAWAGTPARANGPTARARVLADATQNWIPIALMLAGLVLPILVAWLFYSHIETISVLRCGLVLAAWVLGLLGFAGLLTRIGVAPVLASAIVAAFAFAWLTWPVWLSRELPTPWGQWVIHWLAPLNPLLAINGVLRERFDMWDRYRIAYQQLTTLNQDVIYALPKSTWPSVGLKIFVGVWGLVLFPKKDHKTTSTVDAPTHDAKAVGQKESSTVN